ncbi:putative ethylene-responsive binding factor-associated repression, Ninja family [Helianthus debilis subsp. tardiflorus]
MTGSNDLLPMLSSGSGTSNDVPAEVELSLGLSLNGKFGLKPERSVGKDNNIINNKLYRASSVSELVNFPVDVELTLYSPLTRTCSLPPETEVEWRKRKELQSLRRSEAKRKRVEKMKNVGVVKGKVEEDLEANRRGLKRSPTPSPSLSLPPAPPMRFTSQGSIGSQESGGSSGVSDLDSQPFSGTNREISETNDGPELNKVKCNPKSKDHKHRAYDERMPCVSTKGDGPDGKRIQGLLYRYGKGEEVRIVCVCHGSFLTPAEFVKHGGGGDVEHPLRHIVVTSLFS